MSILSFLQWLRLVPRYRRLELRKITYTEANKLICETGDLPERDQWHIAKEEDNNRDYRQVYLERRERITRDNWRKHTHDFRIPMMVHGMKFLGCMHPGCGVHSPDTEEERKQKEETDRLLAEANKIINRKKD